MKAGQDHDFIFTDKIHEAIWKATEGRTSNALLDNLIQERIFLNRSQCGFERPEKTGTNSAPMIPIDGVCNICARLRSQYDAASYLRRAHSAARTSSQGIAELGSFLCSSSRRHASATCSSDGGGKLSG
jgi:hypothetical protein